MCFRALVLVMGIILVSGNQVGQTTSQKNLHPGAIVDAYSREGIKADAYAYGSQGPTEPSGCPIYAERLDAQKSSASTGAFTFHIAQDKSSYLAVYCEP